MAAYKHSSELAGNICLEKSQLTTLKHVPSPEDSLLICIELLVHSINLSLSLLQTSLDLYAREIRYEGNDIETWRLVIRIRSRDRTIRGISKKHYSFEAEPQAFLPEQPGI